jgi:pyrroline-5-carboxylate reductase
MLYLRIGFIGAGQMARALAGGFVARGLAAPDRIVAYDPSPEARQQFAAAVAGTRLLEDNVSVIDAADVIVLAVKPQSVSAVIEETQGHLTPAKLLVSIVAGVPLARLGSGFGTQRTIRVMPNTPCLIGAGASAFAVGPGASRDDAQLVERLLASVGVTAEVEERLLDAVTGLSGSGPAFVYTIIEALSDGGVRMGLPRALATKLAAQTVMGAAQMVLSTGEHPAVLKDRVASPGGTTIAGLQALENHALRAALIGAVEAATRRSLELAQAK